MHAIAQAATAFAMPDSRLRSLERQAQTGDLDAAVAFLRERKRIGEIDQRRIELAAYCGHGAAYALQREGWGGFPPGWLRDSRSKTWVHFVEGLGRFGNETRIRAALAAARVALPHVIARQPGCILSVGDPCGECPHCQARCTIEAVRAWLKCPCEKHAKACSGRGSLWSAPNGWAHLAEAVHGCHAPMLSVGQSVDRAVRSFARMSSPAKVYAAIRRELLEWALR